jgi:hypothetical protein
MKTRSKTRQASRPSPLGSKRSKPRRKQPSPDWDISPEDFPTPGPQRDESASPAQKSPSPFVPSRTPSPSRPPSPENPTAGSEPDNNHPLGRQATNARSPRWLPWEDRALMQEVEKHRPFNAPRGDAAQKAWDALAVELLKDSNTNGTAINRTGAACCSRFKKLVKAHNVSITSPPLSQAGHSDIFRRTRRVRCRKREQMKK